MIRKIFLPVLAAVALAGCVTSGYDYRGGRGDYYYGQPAVEYRHYGYGGPYGNVGYGYPGGWGGSFGYSHYYGRGGYGDPYDYYGYPYGYYDRNDYYSRPRVQQPRPVEPPRRPDGSSLTDIRGATPDDGNPPWRNPGQSVRERTRAMQPPPPRIRMVAPSQARPPSQPTMSRPYSPARIGETNPARIGGTNGKRAMQLPERDERR